MKISCVTLSPLIPLAESIIKNRYPYGDYEVHDVKKLVFTPWKLLKYLIKKRDKSIGFVTNVLSGDALDLIASVTFLTNSPDKIIFDIKENELKLDILGGIGYLKKFLLDAVTLPLALLFFMIRTGILLRSHKKEDAFSLDGKSMKEFAYLRTDTFAELQAGGSVAHTTGVIKGLMDFGMEPVYISPFPIKPIVELNIKLETVQQSRWFRNIPELPSMFYSESLFSNAKKSFDVRKPMFIYQRYSLNNYTGVLLANRYKIPFLLEYNGSEVWIARHWGQPLLFERISERIEMANLKASDLIVVVSMPMREELVRRGIPGDKILVNPNGVDEEQYHPGIDGSSVRKRYHLGGKIVVGFMGTFGPWHGAENFARAAVKICKIGEKNNIIFLFIGEGVRIFDTKKIIGEGKIETKAIFTGLVPQKEGPTYLSACDILVSPHVPNPDGTPFFGSPTKLFEYMAMGKGIVASDLGQIGEILEHKRTAWMVKPGDVDDLADGIIRLVEDAGLRERLGKEARREVLAKYTWSQHIKRIIDALEGRLSQKS